MAKIKENKHDNFLILVSAGLLILLLTLLLLPYTRLGKTNTTVAIDNQTITAEVAGDEMEREKGLSGRKNLNGDFGMLFVFDEAKKYPFWMKDMNFPIDIIWINNKKVVDITEHAYPETKESESLRVYTPEEPAKYVLEVNANFARENGIRVGDSVESSVFK